jgi:diguanylate cyclase (GGDEF)-like protein
VLALSVDVTNQLVFFVDWPTCLRSWAITAAIVLALCIPISRTIGKAHLELFRAKQVADKIGRTDPLTGLPNRRALIESIPASGAALALVIADIDRFKRVNDVYGHLAGDEVIKSVADALSSELAEIGMLARVGGEEFALLAQNQTAKQLEARLSRLRERMAETPAAVQGHLVRVTISAGVAIAAEGESFEQLYSAADRALYAAKASGRNRVLFAHELGPLNPYIRDEPIAPAGRRSPKRA